MTRRGEDPARESIPLFLTRHLAQLVLRLYFRLRLVGMERIPAHGAVLLAGNHSGFLDGPIVMIMLPRPSSFLAKSELYKGVLSKILGFARQIPIIRGTPDRTHLHAGLKVLAGGGVLGVFPEGTRGTGELASIQHGIGYLALNGQCPIVPVVCAGTAAALPKGKVLPKFRAPVDIVFGEPFTLDVAGDRHARATIAEAAEQIRQHLLEHLGAVNASAETGSTRA